MEVLYLYIKKYKALENAEFNFSPDFNFSLDSQSEKLNITIQENELGNNFFGIKINQINGIVGQNGQGKSTLLECLQLILSGSAEKLQSEYIIAGIFLPKSDGKNYPDYIEQHGFDSLTTSENVKDKIEISPAHEENGIGFGYSGLNHEVIYYSNFYDGSPSRNFCIDLSTNAMVSTSTNHEGGVGSYFFEELQRTILYFATGPKYIDDNFNIPEFISIRPDKEINSYIEFENSGTDEVDGIIDYIKSKILENDTIVFPYFVLAYFIWIKDKGMVGHVNTDLSDTNQDISKEALFSGEVNQIVSFLYKFKLRTIPHDINSLQSNLTKIISLFISITSDDILSVKIDSEEGIKLISIIKALKLFPFSKYIPFSFHWLAEDQTTDINLSGGEKAFFALFSRLSSSIVSKTAETAYTLLLDEPVLALHPDWEKGFTKNLIEQVEKTFSDVDNNSIQIFITSHSPFIISDLPGTNVTYLPNKTNSPKTFAANIHELLSDSFFMENGLIGNFAKSKIKEIIDHLRSKRKVHNHFTEAYVYQIIDMIGEPTVRGKLLEEFFKIYKLDKDERIEKLENEIRNLKSE